MSGFRLLLLVAAVLCLASGALAQGEGSSPLVLRLPGGTRALALGNAFVAGIGSEVVLYNPSLVDRGQDLTVSAQRYRTGSVLGTVTGAFEARSWAVGLGVQYLDYRVGPSAFPTETADLTADGPLLASNFVTTVAVSRAVFGIRWGVAAKYVEERLAATRDGGAAFDLGVAREVGRVTVALAAQNLGGDLTVEEVDAPLPTRVTVGASAVIPIGAFYDLAATAAIGVVREGQLVPAGGLELTYWPVEGWGFTARVGARRSRDLGPASPSPFVAGAGFTLDNVSLDYALEPFRHGGVAHRLGLRLR